MIEALLDRGLLPDLVVRAGIRRNIRERLWQQHAADLDPERERFAATLEWAKEQPLAIATDAANAQHYALPPEFFALVLGPRLKYSCAWWPAGVSSLEAAEDAMLRLTAERAGVQDGQDILDLGCGWGALTFHLAATLPNACIVAVSNAAPQAAYITARAAALGLTNITAVAADINTFEPAGQFDRIVSVEMMEHVRNHAALFARLARWLRPDGRLFVHIFTHARFAYPFEAVDDSDWIARHFFTGGMMPSDDWLLHMQRDLVPEQHWRIDGRHYQRTAEAWLANLDRRRAEVTPVLARAYGGPVEARRWRSRWRVFLMACAEMFGYDDGQQWLVSHYRFKRRR